VSKNPSPSFVGAFLGATNPNDIQFVIDNFEKQLPGRMLGIGMEVAPQSIRSPWLTKVSEAFQQEGTYNFISFLGSSELSLFLYIKTILSEVGLNLHGLHLSCGWLTPTQTKRIKQENPDISLVLSYHDQMILDSSSLERVANKIAGHQKHIDAFEIQLSDEVNDEEMSPRELNTLFYAIKKRAPNMKFIVKGDFTSESLDPVVQELLENFPDMSWNQKDFQPHKTLEYLEASSTLLLANANAMAFEEASFSGH